MPLEPQFRKAIEAQWSYEIFDMDRRLVAFKDLSVGAITSWKWDFGDGTTSRSKIRSINTPIRIRDNPGTTR